MRISLLVGEAITPLAGQAGVSERVHSSAADFQKSSQILSDPIERVRAGNAYDLDRGNLKTTVSFSTTRKFLNADLAFLAALDYDATKPRTGTVVFEAINTEGEASVRHLLNALVYPPTCRVSGATLFLNYTITGSSIEFISNAAGTIPETAILDESGEPGLGEDGEYILSEE